ncbi:MAG: DUF1353 domain-containing protein [Oligosphaeraceae bacterium]
MPLSIKCNVLNEKGNLILETARATDLSPYGVHTTIPAGFRSDGMSVPRIFWRWIGPPVDGRTLAASVAHDWLYTAKVVSRAEADAWYRRQLIAAGYPATKAWAAWAGIRLFGGGHW